MKTELVKEFYVKDASKIEQSLKIPRLLILRKQYETEYSENVGRYLVTGNNFATDFFDSIEEAEDWIKDNVDLWPQDTPFKVLRQHGCIDNAI